jgi:putative Mn2+ efflux pump MntP
MKKLEIILIAGAAIGLLLALLNVPHHSVIVTFLFMALSFIYFYLGFALFNGIHLRKIFKAESYKGIGPWRMAIAVGTGIALSDLTVGFMLAINDYPMASSFLTFGLVLTSIMLLLASVRNATEKIQFYRNIILRCAVFIIIAIIFLLLHGHLFPSS